MRYLVLVLMLALVSCQKVIDIDLGKAAEQYVIEAPLFEGTHPFKVKIHKTRDYFSGNPQTPEEDASVMLFSGNDSFQVPYQGGGEYSIAEVEVMAGQTYQLKVQCGGRTYSATTIVPFPVKIDSTSTQYFSDGLFEDGYDAYAFFTDPADQTNYYRLVYTLNDTLRSEPAELNLFNDEPNNGKIVKVTPTKRFKSSDRIEFELRSMDESTYRYFKGLYDVLNNQNGPAPANPTTNFQGGCLGYFGGFASSKVKMGV